MSRYVQWITLALGGVLDAALAYVLARQFGTSDPFISFAFFFFALIITPALLTLWGTLKGVAFFIWPVRAMMEREYLRVFQSGHFPARPAYDLDSYLSETVDDDTLPVATRLKAAHLIGQLKGLKAGKPVRVGMFNYLAAEKALHKYQDQNR